ncbi:hypothetical protein C7M84_002989 [Penaeus vannamei]|uniref:Uncharacterized protein n=1 Tax=Penaeus vannamei TaxID=6689 RepID=A0A3R7QGP9_PENVA|nr:hypothetical protein C7M84_002989 [Penaeus vannamei]
MSLDHVGIPLPPSPSLLTAGSTTLLDPRPSDTLLQELRAQLSAFTSQHLRESANASRALRELLSGREGLDAEVGRMGVAAGGHRGHRGRRQIVTPDLGALQSGYTSPGEDDMPIVLVPEESAAECVSNNQLSSFGFLGFVLNVVNAVINVAITETATNDNPPVMAVAGRRVQRLKMMRTALSSHLRNEVLFEEDPACMALEFCDAAGKLGRVSRLAGMMAQVAGVAAANMLQNFQGVNPDYLIKASEAGAEGENCALVYSACYLLEEEDFGRTV